MGDGPAKAFATRFYDALLRGDRFIDAVARAREAALAEGGNTWGAYQCYGDPDWVFERGVPRPLADEFAGVASPPALELALVTLAVESTPENIETQRAKLRHLEARFAPRWSGVGWVAEAFGRAWEAARDPAAAVAWYAKALAANDGGASMRAIEQFSNLRARLAFERAKAQFDGTTKKEGATPARGRGARRRPLSGRDDVIKAMNDARSEIGKALEQLEQLADVQPSIERLSLCGSAWKRMALLEAMAGRSDAERKAVASMKTRYEQAETRARESRHPGLFYPALNRMGAELVVDAGQPKWPGFDPVATEAVRQCLVTEVWNDPDFWSVVGLTELRLYMALADGRLADERAGIEREFEDLHAHDDTPSNWDSVVDQVGFVLSKYEKRVAGDEKKAAEGLRERIAALAESREP